MQEQTTFGAWLRKQRRALDLTRKAFADQVGCAEITLRRIEAGTLKPSRELAGILIKKAGIPESNHAQWISFARGLSGLPAKFNLSSAIPVTNLPAPLTSFVGREREQAQVMQLIAEHRLVTFTGSGGVGKTRFAIMTGEQILGNYPDGVWLVELASVNDPALVPQTVARLLGLTPQSDISHTDLLINFLRTKSTLLIFDNCEHLIDASALLVDTLLRNCGNLKILVTSRAPLQATGEALYRVPSLRLPDLQDGLDSLRDCESVKLFEERAKLVQFDFSLTSENVSSVVQVCQRLDGIPLAIELAAAKVDVFSPAQIARRLEQNFNLLTGGSRTALPRHQTLRTSVDWSWGLLTEPEQKLMMQLAVFAGGWTLESAQAICNGDVLDLLNSLLSKSLIVRDQETKDDVRYSFHEIVRQYSLEKSLETDDAVHYRDMHLNYFIQLAEQGFSELRGANDSVWLDRLEIEHDNLRAALSWSLESPTVDPQTALQLSGALQDFWDTRGYTSEGYQWTSKALKNAPDSPTRHRCRALVGAGLMCYRLSRTKDTGLYLEEALTQARRLNNAPLLLMSLLLSAHVLKDKVEARKRYEECLALARETRDLWHLAELLAIWPTLSVAETIQYLEEARGIAEELGSVRRRSLVLHIYGMFEMQRANYDSATPMLQQAIRLYRVIKDRHNTALSLLSLGRAATQQTHYQEAARYEEQALQTLRDLSDPHCCALSLLSLGWNAYLAGNSGPAISHLEESLLLFREKSDVQVRPSYPLTLLGRIAVSQGDVSRAKDSFREALELLRSPEITYWLAQCLEGVCALPLIHNEKAARLIGKAEAIREQEAYVIPLSERPLIDPIFERLQSQLGKDVLDSARAAGASLTYQQAIDEAMEVLQSTG